MARTVYHVLPDGESWSLHNVSSDQDLGVFDSKTEAVEKGRQIAHEHHPSQLVVHTADGKVEEESTF